MRIVKNLKNIIGTIEISHAIESLIQESTRFLIFVSPYLKITDRIKSKLSMNLSKIDNCYFIFRKNEIKTSEKNWLELHQNIHLIEVKNLHAKLYLNENRCLLTSMNFYEYSQINNFEIGVLFNRKVEEDNFQEVIEQIKLMTRLSENNTTIQNELDKLTDYSTGRLFTELSKLKSKSTFIDYQSFCNKVRETVRIEESEFYEDKSAILRRTNLGKERYLTVFNKLK